MDLCEIVSVPLRGLYFFMAVFTANYINKFHEVSVPLRGLYFFILRTKIENGERKITVSVPLRGLYFFIRSYRCSYLTVP